MTHQTGCLMVCFGAGRAPDCHGMSDRNNSCFAANMADGFAGMWRESEQSCKLCTLTGERKPVINTRMYSLLFEVFMCVKNNEHVLCENKYACMHAHGCIIMCVMHIVQQDVCIIKYYVHTLKDTSICASCAYKM